MPRNGSGSFSLAEAAFVPNTPISSSAVNSDLSDIADALTGSLARDGQGGMTAVLPLANTGFSYLTDPNTGMRRTAADTQAISAGGVDAVTITSTAVDVVALKVAGSTVFPVPTAQIADKAVTLAKLYHPTATSRLLGSDSNAALTITGAANNGSGLIRLSVASTATFATSQVKTVSDVVGTTEANGTWTITVVDGTHIDLQGSTFANAYVSGGTIGGGVEEISLGTGLALAGSVLSASPVSGPMTGAQGLVVTNNTGTPNTIIDVVADQVTMLTSSGIPIYATAVSVSINTSITGANGMDTGGRPTSGWVNIFLISNGVTTAGLASINSTIGTIVMPSGYTYAFRAGAMRTDGSQNFLRTKQTGNDTQYVVTSATNTATLPVIQAQGAGTITFWTALSISNFVPPFATRIRAVLYITASGSAMVGGIAPNNNYPTGGNGQSVNHFGQFGFQATGLGGSTSIQADMMIESTNIYYGGVALGVDCQGWKDKVNAS